MFGQAFATGTGGGGGESQDCIVMGTETDFMLIQAGQALPASSSSKSPLRAASRADWVRAGLAGSPPPVQLLTSSALLGKPAFLRAILVVRAENMAMRRDARPGSGGWKGEESERPDDARRDWGRLAGSSGKVSTGRSHMWFA